MDYKVTGMLKIENFDKTDALTIKNLPGKKCQRKTNSTLERNYSAPRKAQNKSKSFNNSNRKSRSIA